MLENYKEIYIKTMKIYALRIKDQHELLKSSSGGAFTAFSDYFLENGNAIVSAVYNYEDNQTEFMLYTTKKERDKARGSKYMQAYPMNSFQDAENWIKAHDKKVLFVGTGCQAEGFRRYAEIKKFSKKIIIVDIICHGTPSPKLWKDYINKKIEYLTFKDKRNGWMRPFAYILCNGKEVPIKDYVSIFNKNLALRPSCYNCPYTTLHRKTDITIGDFWGIDKVLPKFYSQEGNSLVLIHTEQGNELFELIRDKIDWKESNERDCLQPNLISPTEKPREREVFWDDYRRKGISYVLKKYTRISLTARIKNKIFSILKI